MVRHAAHRQSSRGHIELLFLAGEQPGCCVKMGRATRNSGYWITAKQWLHTFAKRQNCVSLQTTGVQDEGGLNQRLDRSPRSERQTTPRCNAIFGPTMSASTVSASHGRTN